MGDALIALGVALFFGGLISGLMIPKLTIPRMVSPATSKAP
jgi:hypothetical protein